MSKLNEIYSNAIGKIGCLIENGDASGTNDELLFEEIENLIEQTKIKAGNYYSATCRMYQGYSEED